MSGKILAGFPFLNAVGCQLSATSYQGKRLSAIS